MGSSGSDRFGDYDGGTGGKDLCSKAIKNVRLQDVGQSEYFTNNNTVPLKKHPVQVRQTTFHGRLVVETIDTNEIVGNLPTEYNYLLACLSRGNSYSGEVISSAVIPIPSVVVTLDAI